MKIYTLQREQYLPVSMDEAWAFFSTPLNLARITPDDMAFEVVTKLNPDDNIYEGMLIEYRVTPLLGIRMKWVTKITVVDAPHKFVDTQLQGPYSLWEHTHTFVPQGDGVLMTDIVRYSIPLGILGQLAHVVMVKSKLEKIFDYRRQIVADVFTKKK